jgi:hypothetical protein
MHAEMHATQGMGMGPDMERMHAQMDEMHAEMWAPSRPRIGHGTSGCTRPVLAS